MTPAVAGGIRHAVPLALDRSAITGVDPAAPVIDLTGMTMGTGWRLRLAAPPGLDRDRLGAAVTALLDGLVGEMSHWSATSHLARFNAAPVGAWLALPPAFAKVMAAGMAVAEQSGGAFDPAIGRLTDLWGLGPNPRSNEPTAMAIDTALAASGWRRLAFDADTGRLRQPGGLWLDLSGIAKGHAADAVADLLARIGVRHALVEIGGECVGRGLRPDGDPWWVELETPPGLDLPPLRVALHQLAVATSGDYVRGAHTLDPRTGRPVTHAVGAVSVLHGSAMIADAWATALLVLPSDEAAALASRHDLAARIVSGNGREWLSPALIAML